MPWKLKRMPHRPEWLWLTLILIVLWLLTLWGAFDRLADGVGI